MAPYPALSKFLQIGGNLLNYYYKALVGLPPLLDDLFTNGDMPVRMSSKACENADGNRGGSDLSAEILERPNSENNIANALPSESDIGEANADHAFLDSTLLANPHDCIGIIPAPPEDTYLSEEAAITPAYSWTRAHRFNVTKWRAFRTDFILVKFGKVVATTIRLENLNARSV
ncbi:hypothetical protein ON010_g17568 [Phytophthora cinnamomi]|nr:hypothetical protein ON010_g17568 [Phytophthora cinnamomi]